MKYVILHITYEASFGRCVFRQPASQVVPVVELEQCQGQGFDLPGRKLFDSLPQLQGQPSVSGSRPSNNTYTADGITFNNEEFTQGLAASGGAAGFDNSSPNLVSTEAIREFRVITSNADATFGRGAGGQINIVTRQGTNDFHGSVYYFLRNDALDARNFFNTGPIFDEDGNAKTPPFKQHLYGGSLGGRLLRDRHFFFGNFEGFRQLRRNTSSVVVPNAALFDGNIANAEAGTLLISTLAPRDITQDSFIVRTDHQVSDRLNLSFRYLFAQPRLTSSAGLPVDVTETRSRVQQGVAQAVYTLSPAQILEARGGALRSRLDTGLQGGLDERSLAD